jgi:lysophospholipid acyltransferase (LPLAT)-like uncharacterized protein
MRSRVLGFLAWLAYRSLSMTWRISLNEPESMRTALRERKPFIMAHWHGDELALLHLIGHYRVATLSSHSRDGRIMAVLLRLLGGRICAGSSSRGGAGGLKALIRLVREGYNCSFAVDGPRGPIYKIKPGVLEMSRLLACPIYYPTVSCDRAFFLHRSWNEGFLPKPFARLSIQWHGPVPPIERDQDPRDAATAAPLEELMREAKRRAIVPDQRPHTAAEQPPLNP